MVNVLFLQSDVKDPYRFYENMRHEHAVYYDEFNKIWAVFRYKHCAEILASSKAHVPVPKSKAQENNELRKIVANLARLTNGADHQQARAAAVHLMKQWKNPELTALLQMLIGEPRLPATIEWVGGVAKKLPTLALLKGFGFTTADAIDVLPEIETLVRLMASVESDSEVATILSSVHRINEKFARYFPDLRHYSRDGERFMANFIGLLIQGYDATRGLMSNSVLHYVTKTGLRPTTPGGFLRFVKESSRFDPVVQNTQRIMTKEWLAANHVIKAGERVLVVLASANRDADKFINAEEFRTDRSTETLSFGTGVHKCIAEHFAVQMAASLLHILSLKYPVFQIRENEIQYEPRINVRLPKRITLEIS